MRITTRTACLSLAFLMPVLAADAADRPAQTIIPLGSTVTFAQSLDWLDAKHFVVGRWDGSLSIFRSPEAGEYGPVIEQAMASPSSSGVEMVSGIADNVFVASDGRDGLSVWRRASADIPFDAAERLSYDPVYGPANSGLALTLHNVAYLVTGHEAGELLIWLEDADNRFNLVKKLDVKSSAAPANPWGIHNVRGLAVWRNSVVITGSEDGDLVGIQLPDGNEVFRIRYNETAKRGINNISVVGDWLLVANCAVGPSDKNLWLFDLSSGSPVLSDAENFVLDRSRSQVFAFDADLVEIQGTAAFYSSTEEGLLWRGEIEGGQLIVSGVTKSSPEGGSVIDVSPAKDKVAVATYALQLFDVK